MNHIKEIVECVSERANSNMPYKEGLIRIVISGFSTDLAKMCKNIRETSLGESDRLQRIDRLSVDSGIDLLTLKDLC
jgi:hypothetical protein